MKNNTNWVSFVTKIRSVRHEKKHSGWSVIPVVETAWDPVLLELKEKRPAL
jgi:hypothetical protein